MQHDEHDDRLEFDPDAVETGAGEDFADAVDAGPETPEDTVARLEAEVDEMRAKWMRALADFRNFQQRSFDNERQAKEDGRTNVLRAIMPALDNLDLALMQDETGTAAEQLVSGMRSVAGQLRDAIGGLGVRVVRPDAGEPFDPHAHQAVLQQPSAEVKPGCVVNVLQSGYVMGERVLRPAGVIVATEPPSAAGTVEGTGVADEPMDAASEEDQR